MRPRTTRTLSSLSAWVFGLATSVLLLSVWGRAVVVDTDALTTNLRPMSQSEEVSGRFTDWMTQQLVESGIPEAQAETASETAVATPAVESALGNLVEQVVIAAAAPGTDGSVVDVAGVLTPTIPAVTGAVVAAGVPATETQVAAVITGLDPLVIRQAGEPPIVGQESPIAGRLALATVLAVVAMIVFGALYVLVSANRVNAARTLSMRFGLGGISFAVLLKLGSWILDPEGGRAPVSASIALIADSKWALPAIIGAGAGLAGIFFWLAKLTSRPAARAQVRPAAASPTTSGAARRRAG